MPMPSDFSVSANAADVTLDVTSLRCPMPLLKTRQQLRTLLPGSTLRVLAVDPGARRDIPAWLRQTGHQLVHSAERDGVLEFVIRVGETS
jgi:tRNA 2-thiouridine synthesizing protein A